MTSHLPPSLAFPNHHHHHRDLRKPHNGSTAWARGDSNSFYIFFIRQELLSATGRFYLVAVAQNNVQSILSTVREASRNLEGTVCFSTPVASSLLVLNPTSYFSRALRSSYPAEPDVNTCMCSDSRGHLLHCTRSLLGRWEKQLL